jgi:hypothetical protein
MLARRPRVDPVGGWVQGHFPDERSGVVAQGWNVDYLASRRGVSCQYSLLSGGGGKRGSHGEGSGTLLGPEGTGVVVSVSSAGRFFGRTVLVVPCVGGWG